MQTQDAAGNAAMLIEQRVVIACNHFCHGFYVDLVESTPPPGVKM
jgi:hypothetical protein